MSVGPDRSCSTVSLPEPLRFARLDFTTRAFSPVDFTSGGIHGDPHRTLAKTELSVCRICAVEVHTVDLCPALCAGHGMSSRFNRHRRQRR